MIPGCPSMNFIKIPDVEIEFADMANDTANLLSYSFASQTLGDARWDRKIYVACFGERAGNSNITGCTINGVAGTQVARVDGVGSDSCLALFGASSPTGATGTVSFTLDDAQRSGGIMIFRCINAKNLTPVSKTESNSSFTQSVTVPPGGVLLAIAAASDPTGGISWTGATEANEQAYENADMSAAISKTVGAYNVTATFTATRKFMLTVSIR